MSHVPHSLADEFPDHLNTLATLRATDAHFARLSDKYHEVNRALHRVETLVEPVSAETERVMRRNRMSLKDEIWQLMRQAEGQLTS